MNPLDLAYINRLAPYKVWTENGRDYLVETSYDLLFMIGFMDDYSIWPIGSLPVLHQQRKPSPLTQRRETEGYHLPHRRGLLRR